MQICVTQSREKNSVFVFIDNLKDCLEDEDLDPMVVGYTCEFESVDEMDDYIATAEHEIDKQFRGEGGEEGVELWTELSGEISQIKIKFAKFIREDGQIKESRPRQVQKIEHRPSNQTQVVSGENVVEKLLMQLKRLNADETKQLNRAIQDQLRNLPVKTEK